MFDKAIHDHLASLSTLTGISKVFYVNAPENEKGPLFVFKMISNPTLYGSPRLWQRWRIYVISSDPWECDRVGEVIKTSLHDMAGDIGGTIFSYIEMLDHASPELRSDGQYELFQDYRFIKSKG